MPNKFDPSGSSSTPSAAAGVEGLAKICERDIEEWSGGRTTDVEVMRVLLYTAGNEVLLTGEDPLDVGIWDQNDSVTF